MKHTLRQLYSVTLSSQVENGDGTERWKVRKSVGVLTKWFVYLTAESTQRQSGCKSALWETCLWEEDMQPP